MSNLNITSDMLPEQILQEAHRVTALPSLFLGLIFGSIIALIIGLIMFDSSKGRTKYFFVWLITLVLTFLIYLFLSHNPTFVQNAANFLGIS